MDVDLENLWFGAGRSICVGQEVTAELWENRVARWEAVEDRGFRLIWLTDCRAGLARTGEAAVDVTAADVWGSCG